MSPSTHEKEIFGRALEISSFDERAAFVAAACGADFVLRERVLRLLNAAAAPSGFLPEPGASPDRDSPAEREEPGGMIGPYRLLKRIGEGGFGVVFLAEQLTPVRRRVALKIIKPGMDSRQVIGRFEVERQALAMMDHPNIAKVFDAGTTEAVESQISNLRSEISVGRPYFAMELVEGVPITAFCRDHQLDVPSRLELFIDVCSAVQHAHQKGVIHRDLKPSNILVTVLDGKPTPKVIDFGIAKATREPLTDKTALTQFQQFLGTPAYMSPEQAALRGDDIDTRSDIYSLGVLLYELLTGVTPFDTKELVASGIDGMRKTILEKEPIRPSTRLNQRRAESANASKGPRQAFLAHDLDLIVMKALEKDRDQRYATANGLALDLRRFLNHEPVTAVAPTLSYQLAKFYRRNRPIVVTASAFVLLLMTASFVSTAMAIRARRAELAAVREAAASYNVSEFMWKEILKQLTPWHHTNPGVSLRQAFDLAAAGIDTRLAGQPLAEASVRYTFGRTYLGLAEWEAAETNLVRAIALRREHAGLLSERTAEALFQLAVLREFQSRWADAEALYEEAAAIRAQLLGAEHRDTVSAAAKAALFRAKTMSDAEAEALLEQTLERTRRFIAPDHFVTRATLNSLGQVRVNQERFDDAYALFEESHRLTVAEEGVFSSGALWSLTLMAKVRAQQQRFEAAEDLLQQVIAVRTQIHGLDHFYTAVTRLEYVAQILIPQRRFREAAAIVREISNSAAATRPEVKSTLAAMARRILDAWATEGGLESEEFRKWLELVSDPEGRKEPDPNSSESGVR